MVVYLARRNEEKWHSDFPEHPCPGIEITQAMVWLIRNFRLKMIMPRGVGRVWDIWYAIVRGR